MRSLEAKCVAARTNPGLDILVPNCPAVSVSLSQKTSAERAKACLFNREAGLRGPPTGVKCLLWESSSSDCVMTYLTAQNKQPLWYRNGHDKAGYGSRAVAPCYSKFTASEVRVHMRATPARGCFEIHPITQYISV